MEYYNAEKIWNDKASWKIIIGPRGTGKSYSLKELLVKDAINNNRLFAYVRRTADEIKAVKVEDYFSDINVKKISKIYTHIFVYRTELFLGIMENDKPKRIKKIGRCVDIANDVKLKSNAFVDFYNIIFEEFLTSPNVYLANEPDRFMDMVSTILRNRDNVKIFLVGNNEYRQSVYYYYWGLQHINDLRLGELKNYNVDGVSIVAECTQKNTHDNIFFGRKKKIITDGEFVTDRYPRLWDKYKKFEKQYEMTLVHMGYAYKIEYLYHVEDDLYTVYVYPSCKHLNEKIDRIVQKEYSRYPNVSIFFPIRKIEQRIVKCIQLKKVCFSSDLIGTEFYGIIKTYIK